MKSSKNIITEVSIVFEPILKVSKIGEIDKLKNVVENLNELSDKDCCIVCNLEKDNVIKMEKMISLFEQQFIYCVQFEPLKQVYLNKKTTEQGVYKSGFVKYVLDNKNPTYL